jgi:hypothetical protein
VTSMISIMSVFCVHLVIDQKQQQQLDLPDACS